MSLATMENINNNNEEMNFESFKRKQVIYVVMSPNSQKCDFSKDCYYAADTPCRFDSQSSDISEILLNNVPVSGDYFIMLKKTFNLIKHYYQSSDIDINLDDVVIKIIANNSSYDEALVLASLYPNNQKEIILNELFKRIYYNYNKIIVAYEKSESISNIYLSNDERIKQINKLVNTCYFKKCYSCYGLSQFSKCVACGDIENQYTLISQLMDAGKMYNHQCTNSECLNVLKESARTKTIKNFIGNCDIKVSVSSSNKIVLNENSRRSIRQYISKVSGISPKSWFVDHKVNDFKNSIELGNCRKTLINELFTNRLPHMPVWCSSMYLSDFSLNPKFFESVHNKEPVKLYCFQVSDDDNKYINGTIGKFFHSGLINELFKAAKVFLNEINNALNKFLEMKDVIIYGGSVFSVLGGTNITDYDIRLKTQLTENEMSKLIKVLAVKYNCSDLYVDRLDCPTKMRIEILSRIYDFNNSEHTSMFSNIYPTHIFLEFNDHAVKNIICNEITLNCIITGTICCSNYFNSDNCRIRKYISKGFVPKGLENDAELEYVVSKLMSEGVTVNGNLISVKLEAGKLVEQNKSLRKNFFCS